MSFLVTIFVVFLILKNNQDFCEYWTMTFTKWWVIVFGTVTKFLPFSLTEILFIALGVLVVVFTVFIFIHLFKKRYYKSLLSLTSVALCIFSILTTYQVTAEMAYNRKKMDLHLYEQKVEKTEFDSVMEYFINDLNECCNHLKFTTDGDLDEAGDIQDINKRVQEAYAKHDLSYYLNDFTSNNKPMMSSFIYREFHITGVTFLPLGEANLNILGVNSGKPFTAAHELAHTKGAMREEDADLVAAYICLQSDDYLLRYSGYTYTIGSLLYLADYTGIEGDYQRLYNMIDKRFLNNLKYNRNYWNSHNAWKEFANWWNDMYLKLSGVKEGTANYGDSTPSVDPGKKEIKSFSNYQKLFFKIYYK